MADFRSSRMPSPDGNGRAKEAFASAWVKYAKAMEPITRPLATPIAREATFDIYGFWIVWNLIGGFDAMQKPLSEGGLGMSRSAVYRRIQMFRLATGVHPDEFSVPGITIDIDTYIEALLKKKRHTPGKG